MRNIKGLRSEFSLNVLTLMAGTTIAQAIPIAISPILTRIYAPEDFGVFALYMAIVTVLSITVTGRYELAIMLPTDNKDANTLVILSILFTLCLSAFFLIIILFFNESIAYLLGNPDISPWLYVIPLSILLTGLYNTFNYWNNRYKNYKIMSKNRIFQSAMIGGSQLSIGVAFLGAGGLVTGSIVGQLLTTIMLGRQYAKQQTNPITKWVSYKQLLQLAYRYKNHPFHLLPAHWIGSAAMQLPILIISSTFGATVTGFYFMAQRLITLPVSIVASSIGDVYRQKASVAYREEGEFKSLFLRTLLVTIAIAIVPFTILYFIVPDLFSFVFGKEWRVAGEYAQVVTIAAFFQFVFTPVDKGALIVSATNYIFYWNVARLFSFLCLLLYTILFELSVESMIWVITLINISLYFIDGLVEYNLSKKNEKIFMEKTSY